MFSFLPESGSGVVTEFIAWQYVFECDRMVSLEAHQVDLNPKSEIAVGHR